MAYLVVVSDFISPAILFFLKIVNSVDLTSDIY